MECGLTAETRRDQKTKRGQTKCLNYLMVTRLLIGICASHLNKAVEPEDTIDKNNYYKTI